MTSEVINVKRSNNIYKHKSQATRIKVTQGSKLFKDTIHINNFSKEKEQNFF